MSSAAEAGGAVVRHEAVAHPEMKCRLSMRESACTLLIYANVDRRAVDKLSESSLTSIMRSDRERGVEVGVVLRVAHFLVDDLIHDAQLSWRKPKASSCHPNRPPPTSPPSASRPRHHPSFQAFVVPPPTIDGPPIKENMSAASAKLPLSVYISRLRRAFLLRVHPDRFRLRSDAVRKENATLLQSLSDRLGEHDFVEFAAQRRQVG
jgi:hypothetical protein